MLGRVLDVGVDPVALDADGIHQQRREAEGHLRLVWLASGRVLVLAAKFLPGLLQVGDTLLQDHLRLVIRRFRFRCLGGSGDRLLLCRFRGELRRLGRGQLLCDIQVFGLARAADQNEC